MMFRYQARGRFAAPLAFADAPVQPRAGVAVADRIGLAFHLRHGRLI